MNADRLACLEAFMRGATALISKGHIALTNHDYVQTMIESDEAQEHLDTALRILGEGAQHESTLH